MVKKYLVYHEDGNLSSNQPETKTEILDYYNEWRFKEDGTAHHPKLKSLKQVEYHYHVSIQTYNGQIY
tara:strand:- start:342 stop:545 length:204 start_codon:yes stop_codon:yes gene_type:complete